MPNFKSPLDLGRAELRNAVTQNLGTAPASPVAGLRYYDSILSLERYWNGTKWVDLTDTIDVTDITGLGDLAFLDQVSGTEIAPNAITDSHVSATAAIALSKLAVNPLDRANHTGTQLAATISDFDAQVRTNRLDQMGVPTATVDFGGQILTGVGNPTISSDAANKDYVDQMASGLDVKSAARAATVSNITIAAPGAAIDGVTLSSGDRVLVKNQNAGETNGIYVFNTASTPLVRSTDADADAEVNRGLYAFVTEGNTNANSGWMLNTPNPIDLDVTPLTFVQFSGGGSSYTGTVDRITVTGTQIDIAGNYVGQASLTTLGTITTGTWTGTPIGVAYGGTGATTALQARANLQTTGKYTTTFGDGAATGFDITHNLNTMAVTVELFDGISKQTVYADVTRSSANVVRVDGFVTAPAAGSMVAVVVG